MKKAKKVGKVLSKKWFLYHGLVLAVILALCVFGCPSARLFHISCPCCGVTRAWLSFLSGDFTAAVRYHALFPLVPLFLLLFIHRNTPVLKRFPRMTDTVLFTVAGLLAVYQVLRWFGVVPMP